MVEVAKLKQEFEALANTTTADISPVMQSEVFAKLIIEEAALGRKLAGVISASQEDVTKGDGDTVAVRIFPKIPVVETAEGDKSEATAYKPARTEVKLKRYSITVPVTGQSMYAASVDLQAQIVSSISAGWADRMDAVILDALGLTGGALGYTPGFKVVLPDANAWDKIYSYIKQAADGLRKKGWNPDTVIMPFDVYEKIMEVYEDATKRPAITVDQNGQMTSIYGMKVIVHPMIPDKMGTNDEVAVVVLDSSVALVEASGMKAKFAEKYEPEYDRYLEVFNAYWGVAVVQADFDGDSVAEAFGVAVIQSPPASP